MKKLLIKLSIALLFLVSFNSYASYDSIATQACGTILENLPEYQYEIKIPQAPYQTVEYTNKYTWQKKSCYINSNTTTDIRHDIVLDIQGVTAGGETARLDANIICQFTSNYEWSCLFSRTYHTIDREVSYVFQPGWVQYRELVPSQEFILSNALNATNTYF